MTDLERRLRELMEKYADWDAAADIDRDIREAARLGAEVEREECAKLADEHVLEGKAGMTDFGSWAAYGALVNLTSAIRARGKVD